MHKKNLFLSSGINWQTFLLLLPYLVGRLKYGLNDLLNSMSFTIISMNLEHVKQLHYYFVCLFALDWLWNKPSVHLLTFYRPVLIRDPHYPLLHFLIRMYEMPRGFRIRVHFLQRAHDCQFLYWAPCMFLPICFLEKRRVLLAFLDALAHWVNGFGELSAMSPISLSWVAALCPELKQYFMASYRIFS